MTRKSSDPDLSAHEISVLQRREDAGWFVFTIAEDEEGPGFAYSLGIYETFRQPEIILFGLPAKTAHSIINSIGRNFASGIQYEDGQLTDSLFQSFSCAFRRVAPAWYPKTLTWTTWFYQNHDFPSLQVLWPDQDNRLPTDPACTRFYRRIQPDLSKAPTSETVGKLGPRWAEERTSHRRAPRS